MYAVILAAASALAFFLAYRFYAGFLCRRIFTIEPERVTPAHSLQDGLDYVPTKKIVLFGHHFVSIAGLAPMIGPAIAVIWGWVPALLWVVFGTIFLGAVHDFAALYISIRNKGRSIGDVSDEIINPRARILFMLIIAFLIALAMGVFTYIIALMFVWLYPQAVIPVLSLMPIAVLTGLLTYRTRLNVTVSTVIGVVLMFVCMIAGMKYPAATYRWFLPAEANTAITAHAGVLTAPADPRTSARELTAAAAALTGTEAEQLQTAVAAIGNPNLEGSAVYRAVRFWCWILLAYAFLASILPVWLLLQPRDYLNSFQLYLGLLLLLGGIVFSGATVKAPGFNTAPADLPMLFPFLFITVACGAISGFHCVVSSGTSAKQLNNEKDARAVGYGSMVLEGMVAVAAILACTAGFASTETWHAHYGSWKSADAGLGPKLNAFINGSAYLMQSVGVPPAFGAVFMAAIVVAFAMTSLDSGTRLLRYNFEELFSFHRKKGEPIHTHSPWPKKIICTLLAVTVIGYFALLGTGLKLWALFGTTNQLLASFALLTATLYLLRQKRSTLAVSLPTGIMLAITLTAVIINIHQAFTAETWALFVIGLILLVMSAWLLLEAVITFISIRKAGGSSAAPAGETQV